jgi:hypothetical protein
MLDMQCVETKPHASHAPCRACGEPAPFWVRHRQVRRLVEAGASLGRASEVMPLCEGCTTQVLDAAKGLCQPPRIVRY